MLIPYLSWSRIMQSCLKAQQAEGWERDACHGALWYFGWLRSFLSVGVCFFNVNAYLSINNPALLSNICRHDTVHYSVDFSVDKMRNLNFEKKNGDSKCALLYT